MPLLLSFETKELRETCVSEQKAKEQFGAAMGAALAQFLADLRATPTLSELPDLYEPQANGGECVFSLGIGFRVFVAPNHPKNPVAEDEQVDWSDVTRIRITKIEYEQ